MIFGQELIDPKAIDQLYDEMGKRADIIKQWALMPDAHVGYTVPIGSVILADEVVPEWVGVDIGCGVDTFQFTCDPFDIDKLYDDILQNVPVGFNHHKEATHERSYNLLYPIDGSDCQLGTLGGGNHFIEIGVDEKDRYWLTIHSGSRGVGFKTAQMLMKEHPDNAFELINDCAVWAQINRTSIAQLVFNQLSNVVVHTYINSVHNTVVKTENGYLHRKGATDAGKDVVGVIPGSMGDGVYIVRGKGNPASLNSCSHGAGRKFSRRKAQDTLDINTFAQRMQGIKANVSEKTLNESPGAYKNIAEVMEAQKDNVEIVNHIKPILNVKG